MSPLNPSALFVRTVLVLFLVLSPAAARLGGPGGSGGALAAQGTDAGEDGAPAGAFGETVSVDLVNVAVWVTDRQGNPVTGLTAEDFELYEDGERVEITNFSAFEATGPLPGAEEPADAETVGEAPLRLEVGRDEPEPQEARPVSDESRLHLAIFVDNWNLAPHDRTRVFRALRDFLETRVRPEDRVLVAVHDRALQVVQEFTADPEELSRSLDRVERTGTGLINVKNARRSALVDIRDFHANAPLIPGGSTDPCEVAWGEMVNVARSYAAFTQGHAQRSGGALASVSQFLAGVPGRKVLLYVGSGLPQQAGLEVFQFLTDICPHQQSEVATYYSSYDLTWLYEEVVRKANTHGVTFYTLEAEAPVASEDMSVGGLAAPTLPSGNRESGGGSNAAGVSGPGQSGGVGGSISTGGQTYRPSAATRRLVEQDLESPLVILARETGGKAILNGTDFESDFERLATDLRTYYSLGFTPEHGGDGTLHRLRVEVKGEGYRVRHRSAYYDKPFELRMAERIQGAAQFGSESNTLRVRVETGEASPSPGGGHRVPVRIWVPLASITLVPAEDGLEGRLRVMMAVSDQAGNLGPVRQKIVPVEIGGRAEEGSGGAPSTAHPDEHLVEVDLDVSGTDHVVALAVRDEVGGDTSYLRHELRIGAAPQARLEP